MSSLHQAHRYRTKDITARAPRRTALLGEPSAFSIAFSKSRTKKSRTRQAELGCNMLHQRALHRLRSSHTVLKVSEQTLWLCLLRRNPLRPVERRWASAGYNLDLSGKVAFVAGVGDASGYGWAIAKQLANAGATILVGTWPPVSLVHRGDVPAAATRGLAQVTEPIAYVQVLSIFQRGLKRGFGKDGELLDGSQLQIAKIYPLDATFSNSDEIPPSLAENRRYAGLSGFDVASCARAVQADFGRVDVLVHAIANGPEVARPLLETSRTGYLAASSASAYSLTALVAKFGPLMPPGGAVVALSYAAAQRVIPGYGGGMSSAKAQLESDTRVSAARPNCQSLAACAVSSLTPHSRTPLQTLAWEAGRKYGIRVNSISAGPLASRAARAIGGGADSRGGEHFVTRCASYAAAHAPLPAPLLADDVGRAALALVSDLGSAVSPPTHVPTVHSLC